ncbi:hypothetical protein ACVFI8_12075 [Agarivorans sp. MS3-6]|uniref:hypothetical protein n=1 Tax=Agarivorans sp. TSD2052 TaxID=2937286 RepID=UPI00200F64EB|nr:hypothetical protein [Agarivorans sp. TSD2052]UPW18296.1 hypothetical protein M0C34_19055 [Agarivorans sp. TSD2052]
MSWRFTRTQVLVSIGLLFNIVAALMTNFYIDSVSQEAHQWVQQQQANDNLIKQTWLQIESLERKRELILNLVSNEAQTQRDIPMAVQQLLAKDLQYWLEMGEVPSISLSNVNQLDTLVSTVQSQLRERIDNWYLQNIDFMSTYTEQMGTISSLRNLALFLQIMGLALILARDLSRT